METCSWARPALVWAKTVSLADSVPVYALEISASPYAAVFPSTEAISAVVSASLAIGAISIEVVWLSGCTSTL